MLYTIVFMIVVLISNNLYLNRFSRDTDLNDQYVVQLKTGWGQDQ